MRQFLVKSLCFSLFLVPMTVFGVQADQPQPVWPAQNGLLQPLLMNPELADHLKLTPEPSSNSMPLSDPLVTSAATMALPVTEAASSITVLTRRDIEANRVFYLDDLLRLVPGLDVISSGGPGKLTSVFIRGAASERTLIMVDNIPINDPASPARTTDLSKIALANVERIEIVRGPQSLAFGAGAMGGVINIITRRGTASWSGDLSAAVGRYQTYLSQVTARGPLGPWRLAAAGAWLYSEGFSAAKRSQEADDAALHPLPAMDQDGAKLLNVDLDLNGPLARGLTLTLQNHYHQSRNELDNGAGDWADDPNASDETIAQLHRLALVYKPVKTWRQTLSVGFNQLDRHNDNPEDPMHVGSVSRSAWWGQHLVVDWRHQLTLARNSTLVIGVGYQQEKAQGLEYVGYDDWGGGHVTMENQFPLRSSHLVNGYIEDQVITGPFVTRVGVRYDQHDQFGGLLSYRASETYQLPAFHSRLRGSYGTAFNPPSLYQLYVQDAYSQGNAHLKPEESKGWELGYEQDLWGTLLTLSLDYFVTHYENQIDAPFDPASLKYVYQNLAKVAIQGGEIGMTLRLQPKWQLSATYTKLTANDITREASVGKDPLIRRADHQLGLEAVYHGAPLTVSAELKYIGPRWDKVYDPALGQVAQTALAPYTLINVAISYRIWDRVTGFIRLHNLLDQDYVDVSGYNTSRFNPQLGVSINL